MPIGLKGNTDGSGAIQIGGSDAISITTGLNTTLAGTLSTGAITSTGAVTSSGLVTGATGALYPIVSGTAVASTSGTSVDFTNIPSWVRRITFLFSGISTNGTSVVQVQLGTGATPTYTTSGYLGTGGTVQMSSGFVLTGTATAASVIHGAMTISLLSSNLWVESGSFGKSDASNAQPSGGSVQLAAALTAVRLTTVNGTDTFDAGTVNILYE